jgi:hypothetical protein
LSTIPLKAKAPLIGIVYLARYAEGIEAFKTFVASYKQHKAGCEHNLIVLYKGYTQHSSLEEARKVFRGVPHIGLELDDTGFDIGSYLEASRRVSHQYLVFLNTYTELATAGWLQRLITHASRDGVGIAGAMGSYESLFNSFAVIQSVIWVCQDIRFPYDKDFHRYCDFIVDPYCQKWCAAKQVNKPDTYAPTEAWNRVLNKINRRFINAESIARWWWLTRPRQVFADYGRFQPFPNPHVRSNGFMVQRERLLQFARSQIKSKLDACAFESGADSVTVQLRRAGFSAITVDSCGRGYDVEDWWRGRLFRLGNQEDLLLTDNQSRSFNTMSPGARATHIRMTWGDYLGPPPDDFPALAFKFNKGSLSASKTLWIEQMRACGLPI